MAKKLKSDVEVLETATESAGTKEASVGASELAQALVQAINAAKPVEKKNPFNRVVRTPWTPKDGGPRLKLKRKVFQHSLPINETRVTNEVIQLLNTIRPGIYLDGYVKVVRRKDRGVDIDYPIKTASQRLRLVNQFGIRNFKELLERIIEEAENPKKFEQPETLDD